MEPPNVLLPLRSCSRLQPMLDGAMQCAGGYTGGGRPGAVGESGEGRGRLACPGTLRGRTARQPPYGQHRWHCCAKLCIIVRATMDVMHGAAPLAGPLFVRLVPEACARGRCRPCHLAHAMAPPASAPWWSRSSSRRRTRRAGGSRNLNCLQMHPPPLTPPRREPCVCTALPNPQPPEFHSTGHADRD